MFIAGRYVLVPKPQRGDMFIEERDQISLSPRGATCGSEEAGGIFNARAQRGKDAGKTRKRENQKAGLLFAPAERNVYRRAIGPRTALQRSAMWGLSESRCFTGD